MLVFVGVSLILPEKNGKIPGKKGKLKKQLRINPFGEEKNLFFVILFDRRKDQFAVVASISYLHICFKSSCMFQTSRPFTSGSTI